MVLPAGVNNATCVRSTGPPENGLTGFLPVKYVLQYCILYQVIRKTISPAEHIGLALNEKRFIML